jgi:hypothetical protein
MTTPPTRAGLLVLFPLLLLLHGLVLEWSGWWRALKLGRARFVLMGQFKPALPVSAIRRFAGPDAALAGFAQQEGNVVAHRRPYTSNDVLSL